MKIINEFKAFLFKGDIVSLATAVIIGTAFNKIVSSLAQDIFMPVIGLILGHKNVNDLFIVLGKGDFQTLEQAQKAGAAILTYGNFLQAVIDFVMIGFVIFIILKTYEKTKKQEPAPIPEKKATTEDLLTEIRDLLKNK